MLQTQGYSRAPVANDLFEGYFIPVYRQKSKGGLVRLVELINATACLASHMTLLP